MKRAVRSTAVGTLALTLVLVLAAPGPAVATKRRVRVKTAPAKSTTTTTTTPTTTTTTTTTSLPAVSSLNPAGPGHLISAEPVSGAPSNSKAYRVRYRSVSPAGAPIDVTGLAYLPVGQAPPGGWPVLSYAHGTVGLADRCAPSKEINEFENTIASTFNAFGLAVVASDFEGLGTPGRHPYLVGVSEGRGVLDIVRAARAIPSANLSSTFVVWGHSQGGHAVLFAGELASTWAPELKLAGVVAGAPPSQLTDVAASIENSPYRGYFFMVAAGLSTADPSLDLNQVLTPKALAILPVVDTGCNAEVFKAFSADPFDSLVKRDGLTREPWHSALLANEPGQTKTPAPILIIHGDKDEQIPVATSATLKARLCALGDSVERRVYPGRDHGGAAVASLFDVGVWLRLRARGVPTPNKC
jgi:acetyl esterase/lipase